MPLHLVGHDVDKAMIDDVQSSASEWRDFGRIVKSPPPPSTEDIIWCCGRMEKMVTVRVWEWNSTLCYVIPILISVQFGSGMNQIVAADWVVEIEKVKREIFIHPRPCPGVCTRRRQVVLWMAVFVNSVCECVYKYVILFDDVFCIMTSFCNFKNISSINRVSEADRRWCRRRG